MTTIQYLPKMVECFVAFSNKGSIYLHAIFLSESFLHLHWLANENATNA